MGVSASTNWDRGHTVIDDIETAIVLLAGENYGKVIGLTDDRLRC